MTYTMYLTNRSFQFLFLILISLYQITMEIITMRRCCYLFTHAKHFLYTTWDMFCIQKRLKSLMEELYQFSSFSPFNNVDTYSLHLRVAVITLCYLSLINTVWCFKVDITFIVLNNLIGQTVTLLSIKSKNRFPHFVFKV